MSDTEPRDRMESIRPTAQPGTGGPGAERQPLPLAPLCWKCGKIIPAMVELKHPDEFYHDACHPSVHQFAAASKIVGVDHPLRNALVSTMRRRLDEQPRNHQVRLGPSEVGHRCTRRIAMRAAGVEQVNFVSDPWAAGVGTMIHAWFQETLEADNRARVAAGGQGRWLTEQEVHPDPALSGHCDAYDTETCTVVDLKTLGKPTSEVQRKLKKGELDGYYTQAQLYGLGYTRAGYLVRKVALLFVPRSGGLRDAAYLEWDFSPSDAHAAVERLHDIVVRTKRQMEAAPGMDIWSRVPADPSGSSYCGWCPFYSRHAETATAYGCPGRQ